MYESAANQERKDDASMGSFQAENEVLRERAKALEEKVSENEKKLEKKRVLWQLCPAHEMDGKAVGCSQPVEGKTCPFFTSSTIHILDIFMKIPEAFNATLRGLNLGDSVNCRRVCKTLRVLIDDRFSFSLHLAAARGDVQLVKELMAAGANVNGKFTRFDDDHDHKIQHGYKVDMMRMSPLAMAAFSSRPQHTEIGRMLIRAGADLEADDGEGMTPLFVAAQNGGEFSGKFLKMMIEAGADPDAYDFCGPLLGAIERLQKRADKEWPSENIRILVRAGADVCKYDLEDKYSAFDGLLKALIGRAMKVGLGRLEKDLELVDMFLAAGAENPFGAGRPMTEQMVEYTRWKLHIYKLAREYQMCQNQTEATRIGKIMEKAMTRIAQHLGVSKRCLEVLG